MNTSYSARGTKNNSFTRGRGFSTVRNNISIESQDSVNSPKSKVLHSPANITTVQSQPGKGSKNSPASITTIPPQVQKANSKSSLPHLTLFQDIRLLDNQTSSSQPHIFCHEENSLSDPIMNSRRNFSSVGNNVPSVSNTHNRNANSVTSFDSLFTLMEQTIRNTQEEFRRKLSTIR